MPNQGCQPGNITKTRLFKYTESFTTKKWKFSSIKSDIFHVFAQNIDCGYSLEPPRWGGSNEYPQFMFLSRNKKNNVYLCKPQFYYIKVGFKGVKNYIGKFSWWESSLSAWRKFVPLATQITPGEDSDQTREYADWSESSLCACPKIGFLTFRLILNAMYKQ